MLNGGGGRWFMIVPLNLTIRIGKCHIGNYWYEGNDALHSDVDVMIRHDAMQSMKRWRCFLNFLSPPESTTLSVPKGMGRLLKIHTRIERSKTIGNHRELMPTLEEASGFGRWGPEFQTPQLLSKCLA